MCILYIFNTVAKYVVRKLGQQWKLRAKKIFLRAIGLRGLL
jgi:hypothetical protein